MGRKLTLTATKQSTLEDCFRRGLPIATACRIAGVARRSFYEWMQRGDQDEQPFRDFSEAINKAQADGELELMDLVRTHAAEDPSSARYLLSIRNREAYGKDGSGPNITAESYAEATTAEVIKLMATNPDIRAAVLASVEKERSLGSGHDTD